MGLRSNKEAVKIDDRVNDIRGTFVAWIDATDETPPDVNEECYRMVYSTHKDTNIPVLHKIGAVISKFAMDTADVPLGLQVSESIYPKSAIEGFPKGMTVNGISNEAGTPDKRVILHNDIHGRSAYMDATGPEAQGKKVSELQNRINELEMQLEAEESKSHELEQEVDRDQSSKKSSSRYGPEHYDRHDEFVGSEGGEHY